MFLLRLLAVGAVLSSTTALSAGRQQVEEVEILRRYTPEASDIIDITDYPDFTEISEIHPSEFPEISSEVPAIPSDKPEFTSEIASETSEIATQVPEVPSDKPEISSDIPETTLDEPESSSQPPEVSSEVSEYSSDLPETSTGAPEISSEVPELSSDVIDSSSEVPGFTSEIPEASSDAPEVSSELPEVPCTDLRDFLADEPELSTSALLLETYVNATGTDLLDFQTFFLPTNIAWLAAPEGTVQFLLRPENLAVLEEYLAFASTPAFLQTPDIVPGELEMNNGESITLIVEIDGIFIENAARDSEIVIPDIVGCDVVVHGMDMALLPAPQVPDRK